MKKNRQIPFETVEMSTVERFDQIATIFPDNIAIKYKNDSLTYKELMHRTHIIAGSIISLGSEQKQIAFFLKFGIQQFVSIFGILRAGYAYVPVDTSWPAHRIEFAIRQSDSAAVITDNENIGQVKALSGNRHVINIDEINFDEKNYTALPLPGPDTIMHILYTSGSTGEPKGVYTSHRNQMHFTKRLSEYIDLGPDDIFAYYFSIGFSAHALAYLAALLNGGTLVMYNLPRDGFPGLSDFFNEENISNCLMIPSVLRHFRSTLEEGYKFKKLRNLLIGGETLYYNDIRQIKPYLRARTEIINIYASTELYLACAYRVDRDAILNQNIIPIGTAVDGMEIEIHNEDGNICDHNKIGEMIIYSDFVACGYWNNDELTARDFPPTEGKRRFNSRDLAYLMPDGKLVHVGRKDLMVKIRGQRVDLGEIENSLLFSRSIQEVAVVMKEDPLGNKTLIAYYVCAAGKEVIENELRKALINRLPDYMIPQFMMKLEQLPKTDSGKTDYLSLPDPDWERSAGKKDIKHATSPIEEKLTSLFEKHLEVYPLGINENILQAGHDSLKLFVAFDSIEKIFRIKLDLDEFLVNPTIESLAAVIKKTQENN